MSDKPQPKPLMRIGDFDITDKPLGKAIAQFMGGIENVPQEGIATATPPSEPAVSTTTLPPTTPPATSIGDQDVLADVPIIPVVKTPELQQLERAIEDAKQSPEMTYTERLSAAGVTMEEARKIVDAVLTHGEYLKVYPVTSRYAVTFRTRQVRGNDVMLDELENRRLGYDISIANHVTRRNLAQSLSAIGPKDKLTRFPATEEGVAAALKFVERLPLHVYHLLVAKLRKFDELVLTVLDEGAIQNF